MVDDWHVVYLDDNMLAEKCEAEEQKSIVGTPAPFQLLLHEVTSEWGIPLTEHKCIRRAARALARGGILDGAGGTAAPSGDKAVRLVGCAWFLFGQTRMHWQHLANVAGQLVFMMQFQRPAFFGLSGIWGAMDYEVGDLRKRWMRCWPAETSSTLCASCR